MHYILYIYMQLITCMLEQKQRYFCH